MRREASARVNVNVISTRILGLRTLRTTRSDRLAMERPIIFSGQMVRALMAGTKTQTRRIVNPQPLGANSLQAMWGTSPPPNPTEFGTKWLWREVGQDYPDSHEDDRTCPYGNPGDRLWVRESFRENYFGDAHEGTAKHGYRADFDPIKLAGVVPEPRWTPAIYMPRACSRLTLKITDVRAQRLNDMSEACLSGCLPIASPWAKAPTCNCTVARAERG